MKVVAISLWGDRSIFNIGAIRNCEQYPSLLKEWNVWVYHPPNHSPKILSQIKERGGRLIQVIPGNTLGAFWRFMASDDPRVERVIFRDADSRPSIREAEMIIAWERSGLPYHLIRDHPAHVFPIMAGMWGCANGSNLGFTERIRRLVSNGIERETPNVYGLDQKYLAREIYPKIKHKCFIHDEFYSISNNVPPRKGLAYVGQRYDEEENPDRSHDHELMVWETLKRHPYLGKTLQTRSPATWL
jgi:hypothetical protein